MRKFTYIGELPAGGTWRFCVVAIKGQADVVLICDTSGRHTPRMVIDGKLVEIDPS